MLIAELDKESKNMERIEKLVDTITTLQGTINEKTKTIQLLDEELKRVKGELAILKNERNIG